MWVMMTADIYYNYWLQAKMHGENFEFVVKKIAPEARIPLNDFYKIKRGGASPRSVHSRQISQSWR